MDDLINECIRGCRFGWRWYPWVQRAVKIGVRLISPMTPLPGEASERDTGHGGRMRGLNSSNQADGPDRGPASDRQTEQPHVAMADGDLLARATQGDLDAFNIVVERYQHAVVALCTGILRDASLAEDVAQDTFIRAWKSLPGFKGESARSWLLRIATNRCVDLLRQRTRQATDSLDAQVVDIEPIWSMQTTYESPEVLAERDELGGRLELALSGLPADQRIALLMADVLGYDYLEIAEVTGAAIGTVKSRISRARSRLRDALLSDEQSREHFERYVRP